MGYSLRRGSHFGHAVIVILANQLLIQLYARPLEISKINSYFFSVFSRQIGTLNVEFASFLSFFFLFCSAWLVVYLNVCHSLGSLTRSNNFPRNAKVFFLERIQFDCLPLLILIIQTKAGARIWLMKTLDQLRFFLNSIYLLSFSFFLSFVFFFSVPKKKNVYNSWVRSTWLIISSHEAAIT